jgi:tRNA threonylcarbamoyladenosine biosynthesis protein TsaB
MNAGSGHILGRQNAEKKSLKVLSIDTSTSRGSVALLDDRIVVAEFRLRSLETHSARLLSSIDFLLQSANWKLGDLELIVAGIGPGSFTGIRIGVSSALGLAQTLAIPFAGVSGLDALAHVPQGLEGKIGVAMDAQRGQIYYAAYRAYRGRASRLGKPLLLTPEDLRRKLAGDRQAVVGDGAVRYAKDLKLRKIAWPRLIEVDLFLAGALGRLALARRRTWRSGENLCSEPLYIRPPDAKKKRAGSR